MRVKVLLLVLLFAGGPAMGAALNREGERQERVQAERPVPGYHLSGKIVLGGTGGWDYLSCDSQARRLYISRSDSILVIDADRLETVGTIRNTPGVHGIALATDLGRGYTSNGRDSTATIVDLRDFRHLGSVRTGERPDAIVYDPATGRVFAMNARAGSVTVIDAASGRAAGA